LTGRKIIVELRRMVVTAVARFPAKTDEGGIAAAAYMGRWVAKNMWPPVRREVRNFSSLRHRLSRSGERSRRTFGTNTSLDNKINRAVNCVFSFQPSTSLTTEFAPPDLQQTTTTVTCGKT